MEHPSHGLTLFRIALYGVLVQDGCVLITETKIPSGSVFNFPGGGLHLGEDPAEALRREFMEETGLEVELGPLLFCSRKVQRTTDYPHEQVFHVYYQISVKGGSPRMEGNGDDVLQLVWLRLDELKKRRISPPDQEFIDSEVLPPLLQP